MLWLRPDWSHHLHWFVWHQSAADWYGLFIALGTVTSATILLATVLAGSAWTASLVALSLAYFGTTLPPSVYASGMLDGHDVWNRFAWLIGSPARGLLVYCPYLVVVVTMFRLRLSAFAGLAQNASPIE